MNQHRRPSTADENSNSAVFTHLHITRHLFKTENVIVLDQEEDWFRRGVKGPSGRELKIPPLTIGGHHFQLSHA